MITADIRNRVILEVRKQLGKDADKSGAVLYNGWETLRQGSLYIMGFNPGGSPDRDKTIIKSLENLEEKYCSYTDECWRKSCEENCKCKDHFGKTLHQERVKKLAEILGCNIKGAFAANAIFIRSSKQADIKEKETAKLFKGCWEVHKYFLSIVQPKTILCLGNGEQQSAFAFLRDKLSPSEKHNSEHVKVFSCERDFSGGRPIKIQVIGVRHPSHPWFKPHEELDRYLKKNPVGMAG